MTGRQLGQWARFLTTVRAFVRDEAGQAATEYVLIIGLFIVPVAVAFDEMKDVLKEVLRDLAELFAGPGV